MTINVYFIRNIGIFYYFDTPNIIVLIGKCNCSCVSGRIRLGPGLGFLLWALTSLARTRPGPVNDQVKPMDSYGRNYEIKVLLFRPSLHGGFILDCNVLIIFMDPP
jgi:hypothetical protein